MTQHGALRRGQNGKGKGLAPSAQNFAEHNGNEARQTYHALAEV